MSANDAHLDLLPPTPAKEAHNLAAFESTIERDDLDDERKAFTQDITRFMAEIGKPLSKVPIMGYKELDLFQLFREVNSYGGFNEVVKNVGTWSKIWKKLNNFDPSITDSSFRLKKNYERYLLEYEHKVYPERKLQLVEQPKKAEPSSPLRNEKLKPKKQKRRSTTQKEIARDKQGNPKMPIALGELTIECLGQVIPRQPYITEKHIWPIGFKSTRLFSSMINPDIRVKYTSEIVDAGDKPQFIVTAEDDEEHPISSHSPSGAWREVLRKVNQITYEDPKKNISVSGTMRYGLAHPLVSSLIRDLPNAEDLSIPSSPESESSQQSPKASRKRKSSSPLTSSSDDSAEEVELQHQVKRAAVTPSDYQSSFSARDVTFSTREELEDLENAVAALHALKYCAVY